MEVVYTYVHTMSQNGDKKQVMNEKTDQTLQLRLTVGHMLATAGENKSNSIL